MSVIYFIQAAESRRIKIGCALNVTSRLVSFQCGSPERLKLLGCIPNRDVHDETALHKRFAYAHVRGEWFDPVPELLAYIEHEAQSVTQDTDQSWSVRGIRNLLGCSINDLARRLNVSRGTISRWEHGKYPVHPVFMQRLCEIAASHLCDYLDTLPIDEHERLLQTINDIVNTRRTKENKVYEQASVN